MYTNFFRKSLFLFVLVFTFVMNVKAEGLLTGPAAYASYSYNPLSEEGILTFSYGAMPSTGMVWNVDDTGKTSPPWAELAYQIKRVVITSSFASATPKSCYNWFANMQNITNIEGLNYLNTSSVKYFYGLFQYCYNLTNIDVGCFDTSKAIDMSFMFAGCKKITSVDVSNFNTSSVTGMNSMFAGCTSLTSVDVSNFNTSSVRVLSSMFSNCPKLEDLDITSFNVSNMRNALYMFSGSSGLKTIYCNDSWASTGADGTDMFKDCSSLVGAISYAADKLDINYATPETGYFTYKQENRDIIINGKTVTNLNEGDLSVLPGVTGTASYDNDTKTLYLEDASIAELTSTGGYALHTTLDTLRINVTGDCSISSSRGTGIFANSRNVVIGGTGTLDITAGANGIVMNNTSTNTLDIDGKVTVNVTADSYGIQGREYVQRVGLTGSTKTYYRTTLKVGGEGSKLSVKGTTKCFQTLGGFTPAEGYKVTAPTRTAYCGTVDGVAYNTFCRSTLEFSGIGKTQTTTVTLTPVAGTAVVIEKPYILGDVNGDGSMTMADANAVVNYFLADDKSGITNFNVDAANVNGDDGITMADANAIVNMYLGAQ